MPALSREALVARFPSDGSALGVCWGFGCPGHDEFPEQAGEGGQGWPVMRSGFCDITGAMSQWRQV